MRKAHDEENFSNAVEIIYNNNKSIQTSITTLKDMKLLLETVTANGKVMFRFLYCGANDVGCTII